MIIYVSIYFSILQAEQVSRGGIIDLFFLIIIATIWTLIPVDGLALLTQWICDKVMMVVYLCISPLIIYCAL